MNTSALADLPVESSWENIDSALHEQGQWAVEAALEGFGDVPTETAVVDVSPSKEIIDYADETTCDVIVMGTDGRGSTGCCSEVSPGVSFGLHPSQS